MNRRIAEKLKLHEDCDIPLLSGLIYRHWNKFDNKHIIKEIIGEHPLNQEKRDVYVTVSMTSYPARISYVHLALKSLLLQSYPADRIILWLAESQFPHRNIPREVTELTSYGVEIKWCDDLYGHKKYYYCLKNQQPNEVIITYDDDIIFPIDSIKRLIGKHIKFPHCIVCERAQSIEYDEKGVLKNPGKWKTVSDVGIIFPSYSLNPSPGGGCLIPYHAFSNDATDEEKIRSLAYKNDDLWYMFMAAENGTRTIKTQKYHKTFSVIDGSQGEQMAMENVLGDYNQLIMEKLKQVYPKAYYKITTDRDV